ncbi:unnamed protein product [Acanthoscelides obtectus]|nr:unnamed protein product [Acanthoscelides obtectus]CAK1637409.1 hypothetical protein AOBTE_LOCUS9956 [Acanthoscelides obtectus]
MFSGALYYVYNQLKNGTLVRIGQGHPKNSQMSSRHAIQHRRQNSKSWFLRNAWGKRKNYTNAICKLAKQSYDSLTNLNPCLLLPNKSFQISFLKEETIPVDRESKPTNDKRCNVLYSNQTFGKDSKQTLTETASNRSVSTGPENSAFEVKRSIRRNSLKRLSKEADSKPTKRSVMLTLERRKTRSGKVYNPFT